MTELVYDADRALLGDSLGACFSPLQRDAAVEAWLAQWQGRPNGRIASTLTRWMSAFATSYDVHGVLGVYPMHLLSSEGWGDLLQQTRRHSLLEVGAGAGYVTEGARAWFDEIVCTETSGPLRRRLSRRGFAVSTADLTTDSLAREFDVVSAFNVLDRTARPLTLLRSLAQHVRPGGRLLLSIPLPAAPHVHVAGGTIAQSERLPSLAHDWETAARELSERLLEPTGLATERLARCPYLSRGDAHAPLYVLDAAVWVCTLR